MKATGVQVEYQSVFMPAMRLPSITHVRHSPAANGRGYFAAGDTNVGFGPIVVSPTVWPVLSPAR